MRAIDRRKRAVIRQLKRHGDLRGPLSRAANRAIEFTKIVCPQCEKRILPRRLTDHYLLAHPELAQDNREEA